MDTMTAKKTVGIIGAGKEAHTEHLCRLLSERGAAPVVLDTLSFPRQGVSVTEDGGELRYDGAPLGSIHSFFVRTILTEFSADSETALSQEDRQAANRERDALVVSLLRILRLAGKKVVNPPESMGGGKLKLYHLFALRRSGIPVPRTLATNSPEAIIEFGRCVQSVVYKPLGGGALCRLLRKEDLIPERLTLLSNAPVMFQEHVPGRDIRVYVLDGRILSAIRVDSDAVDFREGSPELNPVTLPESVRKMCLKAAERCGYVFTGMDLKESGGKYTLLECNGSPMFLGFERKAGVSIGGPLVDYLLN